jgi:hypothetical protein
MRERMIQELRKAFPGTQVNLYLPQDKSKPVRILLKKNGSMTLFEPDLTLWKGQYNDSAMQGIIEEIRNARNWEVDPFFTAELKQDEHNGRA